VGNSEQQDSAHPKTGLPIVPAEKNSGLLTFMPNASGTLNLYTFVKRA
jgi:hypothetical protein